jgi:anti-sigma regulatory factor (Ser/Thr protein kinase)
VFPDLFDFKACNLLIVLLVPFQADEARVFFELPCLKLLGFHLVLIIVLVAGTEEAFQNVVLHFAFDDF